MSDEHFDPQELESAAAFYEECRKEVFDFLAELADRRGLEAEHICDLLLDLSVTYRLVGYVEETEKPSVAGLRLTLDRLRRKLDGLVRSEKKSAPQRLPDMIAVKETDGQDTDATPRE